MIPKYQYNFKFASWFKEVEQRKSTSQNWGSLDPISYNFCHMKMIPRIKVTPYDTPNNFQVEVKI